MNRRIKPLKMCFLIITHKSRIINIDFGRILQNSTRINSSKIFHQEIVQLDKYTGLQN